jgi:hypothetical protein
MSELKCKKSIINEKDMLPPSYIAIENTSNIFGSDKTYAITDNLIINPRYYNSESDIKPFTYNLDYTKNDILSKGLLDEDFIYNIKIEIKFPVTFAANIER